MLSDERGKQSEVSVAERPRTSSCTGSGGYGIWELVPCKKHWWFEKERGQNSLAQPSLNPYDIIAPSVEN